MKHFTTGTPMDACRTNKFSHLHGIGLASLLALAVAGCSNGRAVTTTDEPETQVQSVTIGGEQSKASGTDRIAGAPTAPVEAAELPKAPPVSESSPNEVVEQPAAAPERVPEPALLAGAEETASEEPVAEPETDAVEDAATEFVEREETDEASQQVTEQIEAVESGQVDEQIETVERTESTVETVEVDRQTETAVETAAATTPVEKQIEPVTVLSEPATQAPAGPKDPARVFAGPGQMNPAGYSGYGIFAIRSGTPATERDRLVMLCNAFLSPLPKYEGEDTATRMVTVWPVAASDNAGELNPATGTERCTTAVSQYGGVEGQRAISDSERTGWILEDVGPYLLAWAPPSDRGADGASVLLVNLTDVSDPALASKIMRHWSEDVERNSTLWAQNRWNPEELSRVINDWRGEFGPRSMLLLGAAGG